MEWATMQLKLVEWFKVSKWHGIRYQALGEGLCVASG